MLEKILLAITSGSFFIYVLFSMLFTHFEIESSFRKVYLFLDCVILICQGFLFVRTITEIAIIVRG